jgi:hypothetical protein
MQNCCNTLSSVTSFLRNNRQAAPQKRQTRISAATLLSIPIALLTLIVLEAAALGQVRGVYSPGSTLTGGGTVPDPGFSYFNQIWYNSASRLMGPQGKALPVQGSVAVLSDSNAVVYVPKFKFLAAHLEFMVVVAFAQGNFAARGPLGGPGVSGGGAGLTNTNFVPFDLGWHLKWADIQTGYSVYAPTGRFVPGASNNVSSGFWTNAWQTGATIFLNKSQATQASVFNTYAWNTVQQGTGIHPGQNDSVDYSLSQLFLLGKDGKWSFQVGAAGYGQWQTTNNGGQNPIREALRYEVQAAGITISFSSPFKGLYAGASAQWEYGARNTYEGRTTTITAGFNF